MVQLKKIGMAAGTFSVALGIGFIMQNGDALASRFGADDEADPTQFTAAPDTPVKMIQASATASSAGDLTGTGTEPTETNVEGPLAAAPSDAPVLDEPDTIADVAVTLPDQGRISVPQEAPVQLASIEPEPLPQMGDAPNRENVTVDADCVPTMMAAPTAGAMVDIALIAPCHAQTAFTVHHQGMMFTAMTDEDGLSKLTVPALAETAVIITAFDNGDGAVATASVPEFAMYDRAVLQWQGRADVMLSAYENGADFGDPSHIYAENPGDMARLVTSTGGYLLRLGDVDVDNRLMAEVYTFPSGTADVASDVMLVAEAAITPQNCGNELSAQSIQVSPTGETSALDLQMIMPGCDAVGDFLILQNMFEDLTLASR